MSASVFVIFSPSRRSIWQKPFATKEEAYRALQWLKKQLPPEIDADWTVEEQPRYMRDQ
jgi:hypothetical protein